MDDQNKPKSAKKPYQKPELTRVLLNPAQAVLSTCHAAATNAMAGTIRMCRSGACRKAAASGDSAGRS